MNPEDTIVALSSGSGRASRSILRISGQAAIPIARQFSNESDVAEVGAQHASIALRAMCIPAWIYTFVSPRSYTGEDLIEIHLPGNPLLVRMLMQEILSAGARGADPGEFTARAYFNGRIDLTAAEGVAAIVSAGNEQELSAARRLISGELARRIGPILDDLADLLALVEVGIDFSDEEVTFVSSADVASRIENADVALRNLLTQSSRFERLSHEPSVVLVGRPNAGKSTLLNTLAGHDRAVVSPIAGTTRDVLSAAVTLARGIIRVIDVAGFAAGAVSESRIDRKMREHALRAVEEADYIVLVVDMVDVGETLELPRQPDLIVRLKLDLLRKESERAEGASGSLAISALTGTGMEAFREALDRLCFGGSAGVASLALNARHVRAIEEAHGGLARAEGQLHAGPEFVAHELRGTLEALGGITGRVSADDLLGRIFSAFCIGK